MDLYLYLSDNESTTRYLEAIRQYLRDGSDRVLIGLVCLYDGERNVVYTDMDSSVVGYAENSFGQDVIFLATGDRVTIVIDDEDSSDPKLF